jgi:hypothetical protein
MWFVPRKRLGDADHGSAPGQTSISALCDYAVAMLRCPTCGSERLVPLTFPSVLVEALFVEAPDRPVAKCVDCSLRLTAADVAAQEDDAPE